MYSHPMTTTKHDCPDCERSFGSPRGLNIHRTRKHGPTPTGHDCPDCKFSSGTERGLNVHRTRKHGKGKGKGEGKKRSEVRTNETDRAKARFLEAFAEVGTVMGAIRNLEFLEGLKLNRGTVYAWRDRDEAFADSWDEAADAAGDVLEAEARRRAVDGVETPIFFEGERVGTKTTFSDRLLEFLLKGRRPEIFGDRLAIGPQGSIRQSDADEVLELLTEIANRKASAPDPNALH